VPLVEEATQRPVLKERARKTKDEKEADNQMGKGHGEVED